MSTWRELGHHCRSGYTANVHPAFARVDHRPWQLPAREWSWRQSWLDLLFVHWPVPKAALRDLVPRELEIQEFDGTSWIGLVPFRMAGVMRRPFPDMPGLSAFPELNVRLYVEAEGKPGVWFLSLDATNAFAIWAARRFFHLPYYRADMALTQPSDTIDYASARRDSSLVFRAAYRPIGDPYCAAPGTLEHFLTERYCLYAKAPDGTLLRNEVHHLPWPLQPAAAEIFENTMFDPHAISTQGAKPIFHFARRVDVVVWSAERCLAAR